MRLRNLRITSVIRRFSLTNVRLSVCTLSDGGGEPLKGLAVLGLTEMWISDVPFVLSSANAERLVAFISGALNLRLPASCSVSAAGTRTLRWKLNRFDPKWYGGGGFTGTLSLTYWNLGVLTPRRQATITRTDLKALGVCVSEFYGLSGAQK